jgi:hypothetical protein
MRKPMPRNPAYAMATQDAPRAMKGPRELLHIAMAAIAQTDSWWAMPEDMAIGRGMTAAQGQLSPEAIKVELRAMRADRGLPPVASTSQMA